MRLRLLVFITMLALCHLQVAGQMLTHALPPAPPQPQQSLLPDDPSLEQLPLAVPEAAPAAGVPVLIEARQQSRYEDDWTLTGEVVIHYRDYVIQADKVVYHPSTTALEAEGHLQVTGGPEDAIIHAERGEMRLNTHTARFFQVSGSLGVRRAGRTEIYSTTNPFLFSGRELLQLGEKQYRIVDGTMTNCRLPKPDWLFLSRSMDVANGEASTSGAVFKLFGLPLLYLPYLRHPIEDSGRESGLLVPVFSTGSSIKGTTLGEQVYWVINRSMDMIVGADYYSKRGWAPNGDFRYKGPGLDHATVRWNALLDRGVAISPANPNPANCLSQPTSTGLVNQGGEDITAQLRKDLTPETRVAGNVEYLSCYVYRLTFDDNYSQATSSEVSSVLALTHAHNGRIPSAEVDRFESFASATNGDEVRILHLPNLRYDILDRPLLASPLYGGLGASLSFMDRSEPNFHARNVGRIDFYPHLSLPLAAAGWSLVPEVALRETAYSISQNPDLTGWHHGTPTINHDSLNRGDLEASVELRPPSIERDFALGQWNRILRHVIEPKFTYRYVGGIGAQARHVLLTDTTDIATNTNELGFSLTQRLYLRPAVSKPCAAGAGEAAAASCPPQAREWASWQIAQKYYFDRSFGGAILPNRRNVFDSTLDLSGIAFLTSQRSLSPVTSRMRLEVIDNLRIEWDLDYDSIGGRMNADNIFAGYSFGITTVGVGHALLNAVDENKGAATNVQSQQIQPFLSIGKPSRKGLNFAANGGYDFVLNQLQYAGMQGTWNWDCCGITLGYRRFNLGSVRDESQYLYSFTLANFGSVPGINRSKSVFRDPSLPSVY